MQKAANEIEPSPILVVTSIKTVDTKIPTSKIGLLIGKISEIKPIAGIPRKLPLLK